MPKTALDLYEEIVIDALLKCNAKLRKSFKTAFIQTLILYMVLPRRINFTQMGLHSDSCEQRYRQLYEKEFDWMDYNIELMKMRFTPDSRKAIAIDASFIKKSGNKTPYIGKFWSGCEGAAKRGLEILGIGVIDIDEHDCMMLSADQTPNKVALEQLAKEIKCGEITLIHWYLALLNNYKERLLKISPYVVADAWFAKHTFIDKATKLGFQIITRLRDDARLYYPADRVPKGKRGRKPIKGARVNLDDLDISRCEEIPVDNGKAFGLKAYSPALKRIIKVVIHISEKGSHKIYMSTDLDMDYSHIIEYYRTRFQIEFCFREGKQFTGLTHCQARHEDKLDFAFNASLTAVNVSKVVRHKSFPSLSMGLLKAHLRDIYLVKRIFARFGKRPNLSFNAKLVKVLFGFEGIAS